MSTPLFYIMSLKIIFWNYCQAPQGSMSSTGFKKHFNMAVSIYSEEGTNPPGRMDLMGLNHVRSHRNYVLNLAMMLITVVNMFVKIIKV